jgi:galactokinase
MARSLTASLRDVTTKQLDAHKHELPEKIYRRCRQLITENERVLRFANALEQGEFAALGKCMAESHCSLCDDFAVSCEELDTMVELASQAKGVVGARMIGGGFGGCTIAPIIGAASAL